MPPGNIDPTAVQWGGRRGAEAASEAARTEGTQTSTESTQVDLRTKGAQNEATLANTRQGMSIAQQQAADRLRDAYRSTKAYIVYEITAPALETALYTASNPMGDIALTYAAAKLFDPDSAVRDQEQKMIGGASNYLDSAVQEVKRQFKFDSNSGTFTDENREMLRAELLRRAHSLQLNYERVRRETEGTAKRRGFNLDDVVGEHINSPYTARVDAYVKEHDLEEEGVQRPAEKTGDQIAGEPIKGYRLSGGAEKELTDYLRSPDATAEGYAQRFADLSVAEGHIPETDREAVMRANIEPIQNYLSEFDTPEKRAQIPAGLDYSNIDRVAQESAGAGEVLAQSLRNVPESAVQLAEGTFVAPIRDAALSVAQGERQGMFKVLPDVGSEMIDRAFNDKAKTPTADAMMQVLDERYGGGQELTNTLTTDPLGLFADAAGLVSGGAGLARNGSKFSTVLSEAARALDPLSMAGRAVTLPGRAIRAGVDAIPRGARTAASDLVSIPSGVGGAPLREAAGVGFDRGVAGVETAADTAFTGNMRNPLENTRGALTAAQEGVRNLRAQASANYLQGIASLPNAPGPLDINSVRQRVEAMRPDQYDVWAGLPAGERPASHVAYDQILRSVDQYAAMAAQDPNLLSALEMDKFKQGLYDINSKINGAYDPDAARIAREAYNAVKDEIIAHDPTYRDTMADYEANMERVQELEDTFNLRGPKGKGVNASTATTSLMQAMRNNATTNFGQKESLARELSALDPEGKLMPTLAGQTLSSWRPRGLQALGGTISGGVGLGVGASIPQVLAGAPLFSPRVMGEAAYWGGRGLGEGKRLIDKTMPRFDNFMERHMKDLGTRYLGNAAGSRSEEVERSMGEENLPPAVPEGTQIDPVTGDIILPDGRRIRPEDLEKLKGVPTFADGGLVRLAQRYGDGGPVRPPWVQSAREVLGVDRPTRVPYQPRYELPGDSGDAFLRNNGIEPLPRRAPPPPPPPQPSTRSRVTNAVLDALPGVGPVNSALRAYDDYTNPLPAGQAEPGLDDYAWTLGNSALMAPVGAWEMGSELVGQIPEAAEATWNYARTHGPTDVANDIEGLEDRYIRYAQEDTPGAVRDTSDWIPGVGDLLGTRRLMQDAARLRSTGREEEANEIEKVIAGSALLGLVPDGGTYASKLARDAMRAKRAARLASGG